jgi:hypothetical protein
MEIQKFKPYVPLVISTDNAVVRFDSVDGRVQNSLITIDDTGLLTLVNGSVSAPSLNFGDSTTGLYRSSLDTISITNAGVERFRVDSQGYVNLFPPVGGDYSALNMTINDNGFFHQVFGVTVATGTLADATGGVCFAAIANDDPINFGLSRAFLASGTSPVMIEIDAASAGPMGLLSIQNPVSAQDMILLNSGAVINSSSRAIGVYFGSSGSGGKFLDFIRGATTVYSVGTDGSQNMSGILTLPNGTVSAPAINFGDATTGLYRSALNEIAFATNGVARGNINNLGKLILTPATNSGAASITQTVTSATNAAIEMSIASNGSFVQAGAININLTSGSILQDNYGIRATVDCKSFGGGNGCFYAIATNGFAFNGSSNVQAANILTSSTTAPALNLLASVASYTGTVETINITSPTSAASFVSYLSAGVEKFRVNKDGNILSYGSFITGAANVGKIENLLLYSEDLSNAAWVKTSVTVAANNTTDPFFGELIADSATSTSTFSTLEQTIAGACAGNTYTCSFFYQSTSGTWQLTIRNSTDTETSATQFLSSTGGVMRRVEFTYTFTGGATGTPKIRFLTGTSGITISPTMLNFSKTANVIGYNATGSTAFSTPVVGTYIRRNLIVSSPDNGSRIRIISGGAQGSTNLLQLESEGQAVLAAFSPLASLLPRAGSTTAGTAPIKFTSGALMTAAETGAIEFLTDDLYATITTGAARKKVVLDDGTALTATRVPFATTNGRLTDDADMTFAVDTLTVAKIVGSTSIKAGSVAGYLSSDGSAGATGTFTTVDSKTVTVKDGIITSIV